MLFALALLGCVVGSTPAWAQTRAAFHRDGVDRASLAGGSSAFLVRLLGVPTGRTASDPHIARALADATPMRLHPVDERSYLHRLAAREGLASSAHVRLVSGDGYHAVALGQFLAMVHGGAVKREGRGWRVSSREPGGVSYRFDRLLLDGIRRSPAAQPIELSKLE